MHYLGRSITFGLLLAACQVPDSGATTDQPTQGPEPEPTGTSTTTADSDTLTPTTGPVGACEQSITIADPVLLDVVRAQLGLLGDVDGESRSDCP
jgi:hypothetical protein